MGCPFLVTSNTTFYKIFKEIAWNVVSAVALAEHEFIANYNCPDDSKYYKVLYEDINKGKIECELIYSEMENSTIVVSLYLHLLYTFVNKWFGTKYSIK